MFTMSSRNETFLFCEGKTERRKICCSALDRLELADIHPLGRSDSPRGYSPRRGTRVGAKKRQAGVGCQFACSKRGCLVGEKKQAAFSEQIPSPIP